LNFELILNEKNEMVLREWAKPSWPQAFPAQPTGPFSPRLTLDGGADSGERRRGEVWSWF
jgi:hypothetical protein